MPGRPASKKIAKHREQKKKEELGIAIPKTHSGAPVKPKKPSYICSHCRLELTPTGYASLVDHQSAKHPKMTPEECFPTYPKQ
jgi:hypothetical protein